VISLQQLNVMPAAEFVSALSGIFERSPWVAERVAALRPFSSTLQLHEAMCDAVMQAGVYEQLALIRAHPELAGRAAVRGELTPESTREQKAAGLSACSPQEFERIQALNAAYSRAFGFPFVLAVKGHTPATVIAELERRVSNTAEHERVVALEQIGRIAGFRLAEYVEESAGRQCMAMAEKLARFSEQPDGLTCSYLTDAHRATAAQIKDWMLAAGLETELDAVGNVVGRWPAANSSRQTLMIGSHYDTVVNAGKYDGRLGVLLPIAVAGKMRRDGVKLPYTLEIIAFAEEEGVRFKSTFLGSGAVTGRFDVAVLDNTDARGITMREAMEQAGLDTRSIGILARDPNSLLGFIEVHIEQGPVLLSENKALGVVTSIAGSVRALVNVTGLAGHAGTVPMSLRKDAATAAAEMILALEKRCSGVAGLVGTTGKLEVPGGAVNVIPGRCDFSIDIRAPDDATRTLAYEDVIAEFQRIAARRQVDLQIRKVLEVNSVPCAPRLQQQWAESIRRVTTASDVAHLPSGAGHDAMMMASITEVGMLFVRCGNGGISHHPAESLDEADAELACRVLADFLVNGV
jgi:beta-ureidopropionase / N-carbamoyl-L-amino-acid hydrolase